MRVGGTWTILQRPSEGFLGLYGCMNEGTAFTRPGGRRSGVTWIDSDGALCLYGGYGFNNESMGFLDDHWCYSDGIWMWVGGFFDLNVRGNNQILGSRSNMAYAHSKEDGNVYMFGGKSSPDGQALHNNALHDDLWRYNSRRNQIEYIDKIRLPWGVETSCLTIQDTTIYLFGAHHTGKLIFFLQQYDYDSRSGKMLVPWVVGW